MQHLRDCKDLFVAEADQQIPTTQRAPPQPPAELSSAKGRLG